MTKAQWLDLLERAAWTFVQGFLSAFIIAPDMQWKSAAVGALAGGVSALKTLILTIAHNRLEAKSQQKDGEDA